MKQATGKKQTVPPTERKHVRGRRVETPFTPYHLRATVIDRQPLLVESGVPRLWLDGLYCYRKEFQYRVLAYVIMPEHFHLLLVTGPEVGISRIIKSLKGHSARVINQHLGRAGTFWWEEFFDHVPRDRDRLRELADYLHANPVRRGMITYPGDWPWSSYWAMYGSGFCPYPVDWEDEGAAGRRL